VLHEAFDVLQAGARAIAEPHRDVALDIERQPLLGAAGHEVHVAANRPEEVLAALKDLELALVEHVALDQLLWFAHPIDVLGDPEQRVQVAQAALAVLDVGLDQIARHSRALVTVVAFSEFGGHEFARRTLRDLLVEARDQLVIKAAIAQQIAGLEDRGADRHVGLSLADALIDRSRRVPDLEPHIPQAIEDRLRDRLAPRGLFVGQNKQEIDVGAGSHQAAPVAAGCHDRHALRFRTAFRRVEMFGRELEQDADDLVLNEAQVGGAAQAKPVLKQVCFRRLARVRQRALEPHGDRDPQLLLPFVMRHQLFELGRDRVGVEQRLARRLVGRRQHGNPEYPTAAVVSSALRARATGFCLRLRRILKEPSNG
jgi:hypothetical protein